MFYFSFYILLYLLNEMDIWIFKQVMPSAGYEEPSKGHYKVRISFLTDTMFGFNHLILHGISFVYNFLGWKESKVDFPVAFFE